MLRSSPMLALVAVVLATLPGCQSKTATQMSGGPIIREQRMASSPDALLKVAVIPFHPAETLGRDQRSTPTATTAGTAQADPPQGQAQQAGQAPPPPPTRWETATLMSSFVSDALLARGTGTIGPSEVERAFEEEGHPIPRLDPVEAARLSASSFGATGVVLGRVMRYRERVGGAAGATRPASVAFEMSLFEVSTGRRLWTGTFDETQPSMTGNVLRARQYPGGGARWLSASELARWGAQRAVQRMAAQP